MIDKIAMMLIRRRLRRRLSGLPTGWLSGQIKPHSLKYSDCRRPVFKYSEVCNPIEHFISPIEHFTKP